MSRLYDALPVILLRSYGRDSILHVSKFPVINSAKLVRQFTSISGVREIITSRSIRPQNPMASTLREYIALIRLLKSERDMKSKMGDKKWNFDKRVRCVRAACRGYLKFPRYIVGWKNKRERGEKMTAFVGRLSPRFPTLFRMKYSGEIFAMALINRRQRSGGTLPFFRLFLSFSKRSSTLLTEQDRFNPSIFHSIPAPSPNARKFVPISPLIPRCVLVPRSEFSFASSIWTHISLLFLRYSLLRVKRLDFRESVSSVRFFTWMVRWLKIDDDQARWLIWQKVIVMIYRRYSLVWCANVLSKIFESAVLQRIRCIIAPIPCNNFWLRFLRLRTLGCTISVRWYRGNTAEFNTSVIATHADN